jgi:hypothetical protein
MHYLEILAGLMVALACFYIAYAHRRAKRENQ